uniref:Ceramide synthase 1 n=1 Tax=Geospiza parvula TaxID=87175 RepID=A0A8C3NI87_GEOPR
PAGACAGPRPCQLRDAASGAHARLRGAAAPGLRQPGGGGAGLRGLRLGAGAAHLGRERAPGLGRGAAVRDLRAGLDRAAPRLLPPPLSALRGVVPAAAQGCCQDARECLEVVFLLGVVVLRRLPALRHRLPLLPRPPLRLLRLAAGHGGARGHRPGVPAAGQLLRALPLRHGLHGHVAQRDSLVMLLHHVVTLTLLASSYAFRYHNVGVLVLFLHDVNDVQLEFTKLNVYFKHRGGAFHRLNDLLANAGCLAFSVSWFWFRLYWFPLKVLYATCHSSLQSVPNIPFYFFFNALLLVLTLMNIYWFLYIVLFVAKVLLGQMQEVNDVREYDLEESRKPGKEPGIQLPRALKEGLHLKNGLVKDKRL